jgi:hypothetical protein
VQEPVGQDEEEPRHGKKKKGKWKKSKSKSGKGGKGKGVKGGKGGGVKVGSSDADDFLLDEAVVSNSAHGMSPEMAFGIGGVVVAALVAGFFLLTQKTAQVE